MKKTEKMRQKSNFKRGISLLLSFMMSFVLLMANGCEKAKTIFQNLRILTYSLEGVIAFIEKYSGCKNNNIYAIIISMVQSLKNTATKIGFTFIGATIGSLIPFPYLPTVVGGILGSRLADYFNSKIDFECWYI